MCPIDRADPARDPNTVIAAIDRARVGIAQYLELMDRFPRTDVAVDVEFQRKFNHYYRVRQRSAAWYQTYYGYMQAQKGRYPSFAATLRFLYERLTRYEPSFASKLTATHNPELPVWDVHVLENAGIQAPAYAAPDRLHQAEVVYRRIQDWYADYLTRPAGHWIIAVFDERVPEHDRLTNLKKLDFVLWQARPGAEAPKDSARSSDSGTGHQRCC